MQSILSMVCAISSAVSLSNSAESQTPANAKESIFYRVPGKVPNLIQNKNNACWATVVTMLLQWKADSAKAGVRFELEDVLAIADKNIAKGPPMASTFLEAYRSDRGLRDVEKKALLSRLPFADEPPANYTVRGWLELLKEHGPLWVTATTKKGFGVHAHVVNGIEGDGTFDSTFLTYIDPLDGKEHRESVLDFAKRYEQIAINDVRSDKENNPGAPASELPDLRVQVIHLR